MRLGEGRIRVHARPLVRTARLEGGESIGTIAHVGDNVVDAAVLAVGADMARDAINVNRFYRSIGLSARGAFGAGGHQCTRSHSRLAA